MQVYQQITTFTWELSLSVLWALWTVCAVRLLIGYLVTQDIDHRKILLGATTWALYAAMLKVVGM
jgi:hypothetical protein